MNIFILDKDPKQSAQYLCDRHVVKMCLEHAQILSSALRLAGIPVGYKPTHMKHPVVQHVYQNLWDNNSWFIVNTYWVFQEYTYRYGKKHKSEAVFQSLLGFLPVDMLKQKTIYACCHAPETVVDTDDIEEAIRLYRDCYKRKQKEQKMTWTNRSIPDFLPKTDNKGYGKEKEN